MQLLLKLGESPVSCKGMHLLPQAVEVQPKQAHTITRAQRMALVCLLVLVARPHMVCVLLLWQQHTASSAEFQGCVKLKGLLALQQHPFCLLL